METYFWIWVSWQGEKGYVLKSSKEVFNSKADCWKNGIEAAKYVNLPCCWGGPILIVEKVKKFKWIKNNDSISK